MFVPCPQCRSLATIPVVYGKPGGEIRVAADLGLCYTAGCIIPEEPAPNRHCKVCEYQWAYAQSPTTESSPLPNNPMSVRAMQLLFYRLKNQLSEIYKDIETQATRFGGGPELNIDFDVDGCINLLNAINHFHLCWLDFFSELTQSFGERIVLINPDQTICTNYPLDDARVIHQKQLDEWVSLILHLVHCAFCHGKLISESIKDPLIDPDEFKMLLEDMKRTRSELDRMWQDTHNLLIYCSIHQPNIQSEGARY